MKRGERSPEATKEYRKHQRRIRRYMELREELQLSGDIPLEPDGATINNRRLDGTERVNGATQGAQPLPALTAQAVRNGWAVPEGKKPALVDELVNIIDDPEESNKVKVAAFNALRQADQHQWERDNPEKANQNVPFQLNVNVVTVEKADLQLTEVPIGSDTGKNCEGLP